MQFWRQKLNVHLAFSSANYIVALSTNNQAYNIILSKGTLEETAVMSEQQQSRPSYDFFCIPKIIDDLASVLTDIFNCNANANHNSLLSLFQCLQS